MGGRGSSGRGSGGGRDVLSTPKMQALSGSEKQIAWAESIRDKAFATLRTLESEWKFTGWSASPSRDLGEVHKMLESWFSQKAASKASHIIDNRYALTITNIRQIANQVKRTEAVWDDKKRRFVKGKRK